MTKESAAWLAVRIIGLVALGEALLLLVNVATQMFALQKLYSMEGPAAANQERYIIQSWVAAGLYFAEALFCGAISVYLLRNGRVVHRLLMREAS